MERTSEEELTAYRQQLIEDFMRAVFKLSNNKQTRVMHIHTGEVMHAALFVSAMCSSSDPEMATEAKRKVVAKQIAKKFMEHSANAKKLGGMQRILKVPMIILNDEEETAP